MFKALRVWVTPLTSLIKTPKVSGTTVECKFLNRDGSEAAITALQDWQQLQSFLDLLFA